MPYRPFHDVFPVIAERETRVLIVPPESTRAPLPVDEYGLVELFCDERGCDCRRVFLMAVSRRRGPEAVIAWGWEPREFYARWSGESDETLLDNLKGPALNLGSPETDLAQPLLEVVSELLRTDEGYTTRIQEHYHLFRSHVERSRVRTRWFETPPPSSPRVRRPGRRR